MLFGTGVFISRHRLVKINNITIFVGVFFSVIAYICEVQFTRNQVAADDRSLYVSSALVAAFIFMIAERITVPYSETVSIRLRSLSKYIFYLHPFFNVYIGYILFHLTNNGIIQFLYVGACCLGVYVYQLKKNNKLLKRIIP